MTRLAIIGTAGRKDDAPKLNLHVWNDMKRLIARFVKERGIRDVISGGAAYSDHLGVGLFNAGLVDTLTLALPCAFNHAMTCFVNTGILDWRRNPGGTCNHYHSRFSDVIGKDSLVEIANAIRNGATVEIEDGFMARNSIVAKADMLIAFTFGNGAQVKDGGTHDTCYKYLKNGGKSLFHVDLHTMTLYESGTV